MKRAANRSGLPAVFAVTLCVLALGAPTFAADKEQRLRECRKLQAEIQRLESLRRDGGNPRQMDDWKRQRNERQRSFRDRGCHYFYELD